MKNLLFISLFFILFSACKKECDSSNTGELTVVNSTNYTVDMLLTGEAGSFYIQSQALETRTVEIKSGNFTYSAETTSGTPKNWTGSVTISECDNRTVTLQ